MQQHNRNLMIPIKLSIMQMITNISNARKYSIYETTKLKLNRREIMPDETHIQVLLEARMKSPMLRGALNYETS
ncbi:hypothetical protein RCL_jg16583.t1 [Rhizophagus clarus]|uniref:Uncharacterized protein n=1 Tax=Rhizophagus clarus TaxID=94130 RepID=A0A8H3QQW8_9GLOM|nr:hypothetical protein RCL_jg16583.t1 [Rhizophagus clarus]